MISILLFLLFSLPVIANIDEQRAEELLQKYQAPQELADLLNQAYEQNAGFRECLNRRRVCRCPKELSCYIKTQSDQTLSRRLDNLEKAQKAIEENDLNEIVLPHKYLWGSSSISGEITQRLVVEALEPELDSSGRCNLNGISKSQFAHILTFAKVVGFGDYIGGNYSFEGKTNMFVTTYAPSKQFWKNPQNHGSGEKRIALIDTKRLGFFGEHLHAGYFFDLIVDENSRECVIEDVLRDLDERFFPRDDVDDFWKKYAGKCFKR